MPIEAVKSFENSQNAHVEHRISEVLILNGRPLPKEFTTFFIASYEFSQKEKQLGFVHRNGLITRVNYDSPFKGLLQTGDIILHVDGQPVVFERMGAEKTAPEKSVVEKTQPSFMGKVRAAFRKSSTPPPRTESKDFKTFIKSIFAKPDEKITISITVCRLQMRFVGAAAGAVCHPPPDKQWEGANIYQFKYLKLGLNMQQLQSATGNVSVVVNYTFPDTVASLCLSIGESIFSVDDQMVQSMENVRQMVLEGCKARGYARLTVEWPKMDAEKNAIRNQLFAASKEAERLQYGLAPDVCEHMQGGLQALKTGKEPTPIFREPKKKDEKKDEKKEKEEKELEKKRSGMKVKKSEKDTVVEFREKTEEIDIPSEWNTRLFVWLPPMKTKESETAQASTPAKK